jgi:uncharacterized repeat protein (TIGR01451 family)
VDDVEPKGGVPMKYLIGLIALLLPAAAVAAESVKLDSQIFVEKTVTDPDGKTRQVREPTKVVTPGDRLVFVIGYKNAGAAAATDFVITNPLPAAVAYAGAGENEPQVSVDGGTSWGALASLTVKQENGTERPATATDVTHVRWTFATIPAGGTGSVSFNAVVK